MNPIYIKCSSCGRFISYNDLESGEATHKMITPDSDVSFERWESFCKVCKKQEEEKR